jgi:hypothetical protein
LEILRHSWEKSLIQLTDLVFPLRTHALRELLLICFGVQVAIASWRRQKRKQGREARVMLEGKAHTHPVTTVSA